MTAASPGSRWMRRPTTLCSAGPSGSEAGGSPVTNSKVFRRPAGGAERLLANVGTATRFVDQSANPAVKYFYRVAAVNARGESCGSNEVGADPVGGSCTAPGLKIASD